MVVIAGGGGGGGDGGWWWWLLVVVAAGRVKAEKRDVGNCHTPKIPVFSSGMEYLGVTVIAPQLQSY